MADREAIAVDCQLLVDELSDTSALDAKITATQEEMENVVTLNKELIRMQAAKGTDRAEFNRKAAEYDERFRKAEARLARLQADRKRNLARCAEVRSFVNAIRELPLVLEEWDEQLWKIMVSQLTVYSDGRVVFTFRGENTITVMA